ncbi:MAG: copper resistance protein CopC [Bacillus sp. (in: Bacteria)]|nr:copper resistance protein CopC [Bacillus sp. (in: firmicutes)]
MKKISFLLFFFFLLVFSSTVSAHTGLEKSYPAEGQTITDELQEITLDFETKIETGSTFSLIFEDGNEVLIENIQIVENRLSATTKETVKNGNYTLKWKIIGADGHPIEGEYQFVVAQVIEEPDATNNPNDDSNGSITTTEEGNTNESPSPAKEETGNTSAVSEEIDESNDSKPIIPIVIGILLSIAIGTTIWLVKKGKK